MNENKIEIASVDFIFLSYDEPNAEKHWADLLNKVPWAERVHGVKGFDSAHRACAAKANTDWFVTVDADNIIDPAFLDEVITLPDGYTNRTSFCWNGVNMINGLIYGNGGLKLWGKEFAANMSNHEFSADGRGVDFCWSPEYHTINKTFSEVHNNESPNQAFRVGFREGVKLALDKGQFIKPEFATSRLHKVNIRNLKIWSSVGIDVDNGIYAMLGTRLGWSMICDESFDYHKVSDFEFIDLLFNDYKDLTEDELKQELIHLGMVIKNKTGVSLPVLDTDSSEFFRSTFKERNE